jgi:hypothetical protein
LLTSQVALKAIPVLVQNSRPTKRTRELIIEGAAMMDHFKKAWGSGEPRGFKAAAWVIAIAAFAAWQYHDRNKQQIVIGKPLILPEERKGNH